jgi:hypothetical protein
VSYPDYVTVSSNENILKYRKIIIQVSQILFAGYFGVQKLGIVKAIATTAGKAIPKSRLQ